MNYEDTRRLEYTHLRKTVMYPEIIIFGRSVTNHNIITLKKIHNSIFN